MVVWRRGFDIERTGFKSRLDHLFNQVLNLINLSLICRAMIIVLKSLGWWEN